jgi:hypothetical protein
LAGKDSNDPQMSLPRRVVASLSSRPEPLAACRGVMMVRPARFAFNEETAVTNAFQQSTTLSDDGNSVAVRARDEFDALVNKLRGADVNVAVVEGKGLPDEVFPNNWIVFGKRPRCYVFPMLAEARRGERRLLVDAVAVVNAATLASSGGDGDCAYDASGVVDYSIGNETDTDTVRIVEGTGSLILDHTNAVAYACVSPRTDEELTRRVCTDLGFEPHIFHAVDAGGMPIYHTNVMMAVADSFAVVCLDSVVDTVERARLVARLSAGGRDLVVITHEQMGEFAGNMLTVPTIAKKDVTSSDEPTSSSFITICSTRTFACLSEEQRATINRHSNIVHSPLTTIETLGGGSARCMCTHFF